MNLCVKHQFLCLLNQLIHAHKICSHPTTIIRRARFEDSTKNIKGHADRCSPPVGGAGNIVDFAAGSTYSAARYRLLLSLWVSRRKPPFAIVADPEFLEIVQMLYSRVDTPSPSVVSRDVKE